MSGLAYPFGMSSLLERDEQLEVLASRLASAQAGIGQLVFIGGEGGAGKSTVARALSNGVGKSWRVLVGTCDLGSPPRPLGPWLDVSPTLGVPLGDKGWDNQPEFFAEVRAALARKPTVLIIEDMQWADEASLHLLRYIARRLDGVPVLLLATFRDDEVSGSHPLAVLLGQLATTPSVSRLQLPLLSRAAVTDMARASGRDIDAAAVHRRTGGNPFFVVEVLAAGDHSLPRTVRDAVTARMTGLSAMAQRVLYAAAALGPQSEIDLVSQVSDTETAAIDECVATGWLTAKSGLMRFSHDLVQEAVLESCPATALAGLHRRALDNLVAGGSRDEQRLARHAVGCRDTQAVLQYAPQAADRAALLGAHREAAIHLRSALAHRNELSPEPRAELLERLSYECYLTEDHAEASKAITDALALRREAGNLQMLGVDQRWLSRLSWFLGDNEQAWRYAEASVATLSPLGSGTDLAWAYSNMAQLHMLGGLHPQAADWGERALSMARDEGDREIEAHASNTLGIALWRMGRVTEGADKLTASLDISLTEGFDEQTARAYTNLGTMQTTERMLPQAEQILRTGIAYCVERDLDSWSVYMSSWLAVALAEQGQFHDAELLATELRRREQAAPVSRVQALVVCAEIAIRRGRAGGAALLHEARILAEQTGEVQRLLPVARAEAEAQWTRGSQPSGASDDPGPDPFADAGYPWEQAELAWWRSRSGSVCEEDPTAPDPFVLMHAGRPGTPATRGQACGGRSGPRSHSASRPSLSTQQSA